MSKVVFKVKVVPYGKLEGYLTLVRDILGVMRHGGFEANHINIIKKRTLWHISINGILALTVNYTTRDYKVYNFPESGIMSLQKYFSYLIQSLEEGKFYGDSVKVFNCVYPEDRVKGILYWDYKTNDLSLNIF